MKSKKNPVLIIPAGWQYNAKEMRVVNTLRRYIKEDITFLQPANRKDRKTPDIQIGDQKWEIKCPRGRGKNTIEHCVKAAARQAENVILDVRYMEGSYRRYLGKIEAEFRGNRRLKRLKIITKAQTVIDITK